MNFKILDEVLACVVVIVAAFQLRYSLTNGRIRNLNAVIYTTTIYMIYEQLLCFF